MESGPAQTELASLLDDALQGFCGRLAFRVAIQISHLVDLKPGDDLISLVYKYGGEACLVEPDLLLTLAELMFWGSIVERAVADTHDLTKRIVQESWEGSHLRKMIKRVATRARTGTFEPLRRMGIEIQTDVSPENVSSVCWQAALLSLSVRLDATTTAVELDKLWNRPHNSTNAQFPILAERTEKLSNGETRRIYVDIDKPPVLIRLLSSSYISVKVLQALPARITLRNKFAAIIMNTSDVLWRYRNWFSQFREIQNTKKNAQVLSMALTGLALFSNRQVFMSGRGVLKSIEPADFVELLSGNILPVSFPRHNRYEVTQYQRSLTRVLLSWAVAAFPGAIGTEGPVRWLPLIPFIYERSIQFEKKPERRVLPTLTLRFLSTTSLPQPTALNLPDASGTDDWSGMARQILLTSFQPAIFWERSWLEPEMDSQSVNPSQRAYKQLAQLARAIERRASLKDPEGVDEVTQEKWRQEWLDYLNRISIRGELDRFLRLRLLEMLDDSTIMNSSYEQLTVAQVLLEWGSFYDLRQLFSRVFATRDETARNTANTSRKDLRKDLLRTIWREILLAPIRDEKRLEAQDPRESWISLRRTELLHDQLAEISLVALGPNAGDYSELADVLKELQRETLEALTTSDLRPVRAEIRQNSTQEQVVVTLEGGSTSDLIVYGAVRNPNSPETTLFIKDLGLDTRIVNLFASSRQEVEAFMRAASQETYYVLAVVATEYLPSKEGELFRYAFNCGLDYLVPRAYRDRPLIKRGDHVIMPVRQSLRDQKLYIPDREPVQRIRPKLGVNEVARVTVAEPSNRREGYVKRIEVNVQPDNPEPYLWFPDISVSFREERPDAHQVYARVRLDGTYEPLDGNLTDLLIDTISPQVPREIVLTLISQDSSETGERGWRFSARAGKNYFIHRRQFDPTSVEELDRQLARLEEIHGLLVVVEPHVTDEGVQLALCMNSIGAPQLEALYPKLTYPFDERNIRWRKLFTRGETYTARKYPDGRWQLELERPIPGFPRQVVVWLQGSLGPPDSTSMSFRVENWDARGWYRAQLLGSRVEVDRLEPVEDWEEFLQRWLYLKKGDLIYLANATQRVNVEAATVKCATDEGMSVFVEADSLTMLPLDPTSVPYVTFRRPAEVTREVSWRLSAGGFSIDSDQIPVEARKRGQVIGIITEAPRYSVSGDILCKVVWQAQPEPLVEELLIEAGEGFRAFVGDKIEGTFTGSAWTFQIFSPRINVRALWTIQAAPTVDRGRYLGDVYFGGRNSSVVEVAPGELVAIPAQPSQRRHLHPVTGEMYVDPGPWRVRNVSRSPFWSEDWYQYKRSILHLPDGLLAGSVPAQGQDTNVVIEDVYLKVRPSAGRSDLYSLGRQFRLRDVDSSFRTIDDAIEWERIFSEYLQAPYNLDGTLVRTTVPLQEGTLYKTVVRLRHLRVPVRDDSPDGRIEWVDTVPLTLGEAPFVPHARYPVECFVRLRPAPGPVEEYMASFRDATAYTPAQFKTHTDAGLNETIKLAMRLIYVGREDTDPSSDLPYKEPHHRFEWGYGKTLLAPQSQLRFNGQPFETADLLLFHGDEITALSFSQAEQSQTSTQETEGATSIIINIERIHLVLSHAHQIYRQRTDHRFVHALNLVAEDGTWGIESVEGLAGDTLDEDSRVFGQVRARLSERSLRKLDEVRNLSAMSEQTGTRITILGRLQEAEFKRSRGKSVVFERVPITMRSHTNEDGISDGELIFLEAVNIKPLDNDIALRLKLSDALTRVDSGIGPEFRAQILLLRRDFSAREDLLYRISQSSEANRLSNRILLVRVNRDTVRLAQSEVDRVHVSMIERMPSRQIDVLARELVSAAGALLAAIVTIEADNEHLQVELRPGVFVSIALANVKVEPAERVRGTVVGIVKAADSGEYQVIQAAHSHAYYITNATRPAVALPKDSLLRPLALTAFGNRAPSWKQPLFTIGGLPGISAAPGTYDASITNWSEGGLEDFLKLMNTAHPKIVRLGRDYRTGTFRIGLPDDQFPAGRLQIATEGLTISYLPLSNASSAGAIESSLPLEWRFLSFEDGPATTIAKRMQVEHWKYHDKKTGFWSENQVVTEELSSTNVFTGPLFFQLVGNSMRLRFRAPTDLRQLGFPVEEIIASLREKPELTATYPVAGLSESGLWIELVPGRIAELPGQLVVKEAGSRRHSLARLNWRAFAPGDMVELKLIEGPTFEMDYIALRSWRPGTRNQLAGRRCILPVLDHDPETGALLLGAAEYTLTIPAETPINDASLIALHPDNTFQGMGDTLPSQDDVVLLQVDKDGVPSIVGFPDLDVQPEYERAEVWATSALQELILTRRQSGKYEFNLQGLKKVLVATGGTLPFTVERSLSYGKVFVSRRRQDSRSNPPPGTLSLAYVLGMVDGQTVLLHSGSTIWKLPPNSIVNGLPPELYETAIEILRDSGQEIWLLRESSGQLFSGIGTPEDPEITVAPVASVGLPSSTTTTRGLICLNVETLSLHWLPANHAAWTSLSLDQLTAVFVSEHPRLLRVRQMLSSGNTPFISVTAAKDAAHELNSLQPGRELTVELLDSADGSPNEMAQDASRRYLVRSTVTQVIMEYRSDYAHGAGMWVGALGPFAVEVEQLSVDENDTYQITVVPLETRRLRFDLPSTIGNVLQHTDPLSSQLPSDALAQHSVSEREPEFNLLTCPIVTLQQMLHAAYRDDQPGSGIPMSVIWMRRNLQAPEMSLRSALIAIVMLNRARNPRREEAVELLHNAARRALRSLHVEVLSTLWLNGRSARHGQPAPGLWRRLQQVEQYVWSAPLNVRGVAAIRQFCYAVYARNLQDLLPIADALLASIGELSTIDRIQKEADALVQLINISHALQPARSSYRPQIEQQHLEQIHGILGYLMAQTLDITLLDPLPAVTGQR
ncbi:MAG: hypothetical protein M3437_08775 [Chloroflexota bacterium]|nr:hypothetical protein [Chloroflexota bacterium]